jgi:hypothetical protein
MHEYEIYALKYAGPFTNSGAFRTILAQWEGDDEKTSTGNFGTHAQRI